MQTNNFNFVFCTGQQLVTREEYVSVPNGCGAYGISVSHVMLYASGFKTFLTKGQIFAKRSLMGQIDQGLADELFCSSVFFCHELHNFPPRFS